MNFHFCEYNAKANFTDSESYYCGWDQEKREKFLMGLAEIAGTHSYFPFWVAFRVKDYHTSEEAKNDLRKAGLTDEQINGEPLVYFGLFHDFFHGVIELLDAINPLFGDDISFVFDGGCSPSEKTSAHQAFDLFKVRDRRFRGISWGDDEKEMPLQAADLFAARASQIETTQQRTRGEYKFKKIDYLLWGNALKNRDPMRKYGKFIS